MLQEREKDIVAAIGADLRKVGARRRSLHPRSCYPAADRAPPELLLVKFIFDYASTMRVLSAAVQIKQKFSWPSLSCCLA